MSAVQENRNLSRNKAEEALVGLELRALTILDDAVISAAVATMLDERESFKKIFISAFGKMKEILPNLEGLPIIINGQTTFLTKVGLSSVPEVEVKLHQNRSYEITPTYIPGTKKEKFITIMISPISREVIIRRSITGEVVVDSTDKETLS